ncbi:MAG: NAD-dependent epimerase/dehydratase family protein [Candidatus Aminicenantes bacterium]|nr:MAG: NAD-dependent epimerase/dehydratase family protein [Candidatus Aminicenantes bacterium]
MKILIIGGSRFLGYHIAKRLIQDGHDITLFNRCHTPDDFGSRVERICGDRNDGDFFFNALKEVEFDVVIDMIAYKATDSQTAVKTFRDNVEHYIHISTGAVYLVTQDYPCPLREEDYDRPLFPRPRTNDEWWMYGYNKRKCEDVLREAHQRHGFPVTMFRLPFVIGERDNTLRAYSYFIRLMDKKPQILPDSGLVSQTYIYQGDIVNTVASNLQNALSIGEVYNLAQDEIVTLREFVHKAAEILVVDVELVDIPSKILAKTSLGTSFSPFFGRRPFVMNANKANRDLDFSSTAFDTWMRKTIQWYIEEYRGDPPENYWLRDKEMEIIRRYKDALKSV